MIKLNKQVNALESILVIMGNIKYGISVLPEDCAAYADGYRFGAYKHDFETGETHVMGFFKTKIEIQAFVNTNPEYGKGLWQ